MKNEAAPQQEIIQFPEIAAAIGRMIEVDQDMREHALQEPEFWDEAVDVQNTQEMKGIIDGIGWPTISKVGAKASHEAWLLVQHADHDVGFQERCLELMKAENDSEVIVMDIAYLEDRVRVNMKEAQLYGTQFLEVEGKFVPKEIEDPEHVDERRKSVGLGTLGEGIARMDEKYKA